MLPGPRVAYNPYKNLNRVLKRSDMVLGLLRKKGVLSEDEYRLALAEEPNIAGLQRKVDESIEKEIVQAPMTSAAMKVPAKPAEDQEEAAPAAEGIVKPAAGEQPKTPQEPVLPPGGEEKR
jgi:monofunctional biosynthetic peptidoglycan transglycosylase